MQTNFYLGIDVSKGYADFTILNKNKVVVEEDFQIDDTFDGHNRLYEVVSKLLEKHPESILYAAVESTGGYENNWYNFLLKLQGSLKIRVARLNPLGVHHSSKASMQRIITDKTSSKTIAEYLISYPEVATYQQEDKYSAAKRALKTIELLKKQQTQLLNHLHSLLYISNTELLSYCKKGIPDWTLKLLIKYPTAKKLSGARIETLSKIPYISVRRATDLIENAKNSVSSANDEIIEDTVRSLSEQILSHKKIVAKQVKMLEKKMELPEEVNLLVSFKGIGVYSAVGLMAEIVAVERFKSVKHLASYFGLHPVYKISGDGKSGFRMSKKGRSLPRKLLYNIALTAIRSNPHIKNIYHKHRNKGMKSRAAIGAVMHKILRIIYGMLKNKTEYNPKTDIKNIEKNINLKTKQEIIGSSEIKKLRRYHSYDDKAPISKRQSKKRKENKLAPK
jgi:transposase